MSCKSETKEIDGVEYSVTQLPAVASVKMLHRLLKVLGPGAPALASLDASNPKDPSNIGGILEGVSTILQSTDENQFMSLVSDLVKSAKVNRDGNGFKSIRDLDEEFSGNTFSLFKIAAFVIQVNFAPFLRGSMVSKAMDSFKGQQGQPPQSVSQKTN